MGGNTSGVEDESVMVDMLLDFRIRRRRLGREVSDSREEREDMRFSSRESEVRRGFSVCGRGRAVYSLEEIERADRTGKRCVSLVSCRVSVMTALVAMSSVSGDLLVPMVVEYFQA